MGKRISVGVTVAGLVLVVALFIYSIISNQLDLSAAVKFILVFVSLVVSLAKLTGGVPRGGRSPAFYFKAYEGIIGDAFKGDRKSVKLLAAALKCYNENRFEKAIGLFERLEGRATNASERRTVGLFIGLCYTDWGLCGKTVEKLSELVERGEVNFSVYNNLGFAYKILRRYDEAIDAFENALYYAEDGDFAVAHLNIASVYFAEDELCAAEDHAQKALSHSEKMGQASAMLAIICAANEDKEGFDKYFSHAVANGQNSAELREAVNAYLAHISEEE